MVVEGKTKQKRQQSHQDCTLLNIYNKLGLIYVNLNYTYFGIYYYEISLKILPYYPLTIQNLIQMYQKLGLKQQVKFYNKILIDASSILADRSFTKL